MSWQGLPWPGRREPRPGDPSVWLDLKTGRAGLPLRLGLSLAAAAVFFALLMFVLGMIQIVGGVRDEHVATGLAVAGAGWCGTLAWLWSSYRRWRRVLRTVFVVLGIWFITIPVCVLIAETVRGGTFLIAGCVFLSIAASIAVIAVNAYHATAGRSLEDHQGTIIVTCPECGYSMVGLESCQCPECGSAYTIDKLIRDQNYAALGRVAAAEVEHDVEAPRVPPALPEPQPE